MRECSKWKCDNPRLATESTCAEHPTLVHHNLSPNDVSCPKCGEQGAGTIYDDLWYCLDDYGYTGCGELFDPYDLTCIVKKTKW